MGNQCSSGCYYDCCDINYICTNNYCNAYLNVRQLCLLLLRLGMDLLGMRSRLNLNHCVFYNWVFSQKEKDDKDAWSLDYDCLEYTNELQRPNDEQQPTIRKPR